MEKKEFKIELKQKSKITGMRCDSENAGNCRGCYYHKFQRNKETRKIEIDYCTSYHLNKKEAQSVCKGQWIYEED